MYKKKLTKGPNDASRVVWALSRHCRPHLVAFGPVPIIAAIPTPLRCAAAVGDGGFWALRVCFWALSCFWA